MSDSPSLNIRNLEYRYPGSASWTLRVEELRLDPGEQMLLTGGSGSGKSTLLNLIAGLMEPTAGTINVGGQVIHELSAHRRDLFRGQHIGMIFQTFNLLPGFSAMENVMLALLFSDIPGSEHEKRAADWLTRLGVEQMRRPPEQLSVGQQQRVAVARAMVCEPVIVLADEPTASLDPENAQTAIELIQSSCREAGAALLCVSHDPSMVERFARHQRIDELATGAEAAA